MIGGKAPILQKSRLSAALAPRARYGRAEASAAHVGGQRAPLGAFPQSRLDVLGGDAKIGQLALYAHRPLTARGPIRDEVPGKARIVQGAAFAQARDDRRHGGRIEAALAQARRQRLRGEGAPRRGRLHAWASAASMRPPW